MRPAQTSVKGNSVQDTIAGIRVIADRVNEMRLEAPADDPLQGTCLKIVGLCRKVEAWIRLEQSGENEIPTR